MRNIILFALFLLSPICVASDINERINFIEQKLNQSEQHSFLWQNGWLTFLAGSSALQANVQRNTSDPDMEYDLRVKATTAFLGAADLLMDPMETHKFAKELRAMPADTPEQQQAKLDRAEYFLTTAASYEKKQKSWKKHLLAGVVASLSGLAVGVGDDRPKDGWATFATGLLVAEFKIYTAPDNLVAAEQAYKNGQFVGHNSQGIYQNNLHTAPPGQWHFFANGPQIGFVRSF